MTVSRRRFLAISAAATGALVSGASASAAAKWRGRALGAPASLRLTGLSDAEAAPIFHAVEAELERLENIFSLYRARSAVSLLNSAGRLTGPPPDLLELLSLCDALHEATDGAFDPTVQPLFEVHAHAMQRGGTVSEATLAAAHARVGWDEVHYNTQHIRLERDGAALTFNGVAQGYITDRIASLLRSQGLTNVLIDMGEVAAMGQNPDTGAPWRAGIHAPDGTLVKRLHLSDRALASSAPAGFKLSDDGRIGHIFHPGMGITANGAVLVSVSAESAALADGLSTALCVLDPARHDAVLRAFPNAALEFIA